MYHDGLFGGRDICTCMAVDFTPVEYSPWHYRDVIMGAMASQITSLTIVYATVYSGAEESAKSRCHWPLCGEFTGDR